MIDSILLYARALSAPEEVFVWLNTTGKKHIKDLAIGEHLVDYLVSPAAPKRLQKMSYVDAKRKADAWSKANQKKGRDLIDTADDIELIHDFFDGTKIVKLKTKKALQREGFFMGHCVGGYNVSDEQQIYSYRDKNNEPHATFEVQKNNNQIVQIKGKGNGAIHPKYIHPILAFLNAIGMHIRPSDMRNLGYYHVDSSHLQFLQNFDTLKKQIVIIGGEAYTF